MILMFISYFIGVLVGVVLAEALRFARGLK